MNAKISKLENSEKLIFDALSIVCVLLFLLIPTIVWTSGIEGSSGNHSPRIKSETTFYLPWVILSYIIPDAEFNSNLLKVHPVWIAMILAIPTLLCIKEIYTFTQKTSETYEQALKIVGYTFLQAIVYFIIIFSSGVNENFIFVPTPHIVIITIFGLITFYKYKKAKMDKKTQPSNKQQN